jgi:hypothetical protein
MNILNKLLAIVIMGLIGCFVLGISVNLLLAAGSESTGTAGPGILTALGIALVVGLTAPTGRAAWVRLLLINGLASLALPLVGLVDSVMSAPGAVRHASFAAGGSYAAEAGAQAGAVLGGAMVTGAMALVGFFLAAIFLTLAFFLRPRHA